MLIVRIFDTPLSCMVTPHKIFDFAGTPLHFLRAE